MKTKSHLFEADVLRGIAILMVISVHVFNPLARAKVSGFVASHLLPFTVRVASYGWAGVSLFFVLSGFCIQISFLKSGEFSSPYFFWRRFWRIYPAFLVTLIFFYVLFFRSALTATTALKQGATHLLLVHNFFPVCFDGINPAFWSIAVEMQLYLLFPLLVWLRGRYGMRGCLAVTFVAGLICRLIVYSVVGYPEVPRPVTPVLFSTPFSSWFDWTLGAYVAECVFTSKTAFKWHAIWIVLLLPVFYLTVTYRECCNFSFLTVSLIAALVLDWMISAKLRDNALFKISAGVGTISYSLYLWHMPLLYRLQYYYGALPPALDWLAVFATIFLIAWCSYVFIERQGIRLGSRLWKQENVKPCVKAESQLTGR